MTNTNEIFAFDYHYKIMREYFQLPTMKKDENAAVQIKIDQVNSRNESLPGFYFDFESTCIWEILPRLENSSLPIYSVKINNDETQFLWLSPENEIICLPTRLFDQTKEKWIPSFDANNQLLSIKSPLHSGQIR